MDDCYWCNKRPSVPDWSILARTPQSIRFRAYFCTKRCRTAWLADSKATIVAEPVKEVHEPAS